MTLRHHLSFSLCLKAMVGKNNENEQAVYNIKEDNSCILECPYGTVKNINFTNSL